MSSDVFSQSSKREKSSRNLHQRRQVSSILTATEEISENRKNKDLAVRFLFVKLFSSLSAHLILLSMDMAQMFLQRRSRLRVVCWIESFSESLPQASASWSRTSQSVSTDATLSVCCSMSRCRSCGSNRTM